MSKIEISTPAIAAWIGLDWADQTHVYALEVSGSEKIETGQLQQTPEAIHQWAQQLEQRFAGQPVAIALEQSRGALIFALMAHPFLLIYPVNPHAMAQYRKAFKVSGAKSDEADARLQLDFLLKHRDQLRLWQPDTVETRLLRLLCEDRRQAVDQRTALHNQLTSQLKICFPQALDWIQSWDYPLACAFLKRWPSLHSLQNSKPNTLRRFLAQQGCRKLQRYEPLIGQIRSSQPLTTDPALLRAGLMKVTWLVDQIRCLTEAIENYNQQISQLFSQHQDHDLFCSLPGAGPALGPRLLCALGTDRSRFQDAQEVQTLFGIAPVMESSGQSRWVHWRWPCPKFIRQTFHEFAGASIPLCSWAAAFYQKMRGRGKRHHAAVRALAFKWIRIIYACWKNRTPYSESQYLTALEKRQQPLLAAGAINAR